MILPVLRICPFLTLRVCHMATSTPSNVASMSPPVITIWLSQWNFKVGPCNVHSSPAVLNGFPNSWLATFNDSGSIAPDGGTPTSQYPKRPLTSCIDVWIPDCNTSTFWVFHSKVFKKRVVCVPALNASQSIIFCKYSRLVSIPATEVFAKVSLMAWIALSRFSWVTMILAIIGS